jgi:hypothetical protein
MSDEIGFEEMSALQDEVDAKRKKLERSVLYSVIILSVIGLATADQSPSVINSIVLWFSPSGGHLTNITRFSFSSGNDWAHNSSQRWPTFNYSFVRFNVTVSDVDLNDWHTIFVCNTTDFNYTLMQNGVVFRYNCGHNHVQLCNYSDKMMSTDNPLYCDFNVNGWANQTQNFTLFVLDSGGNVSAANASFAVDRPPHIINIHLSRI